MATTLSLGLALLWQVALDPGAARTPILRVETSEPAVAITFDACATRTQDNGFDRAIFDLLRAQQVPATIFVSGRWVESHPDAMGQLAADALIEFGDHSYDHPHMRRLTSALIGEQIDQTEAALGRYGKKSVAFRPPFGEWNPRVLDVVQDRNLPAVLWDVVSGDPSASITAQEITRTVLRKTKPGSIVIFHINGRARRTAEALPVILRELRARGLRFVHLSQLLAGPAPLVTPPPLTPPPLLTPAPFAPPPLMTPPLPSTAPIAPPPPVLARPTLPPVAPSAPPSPPVLARPTPPPKTVAPSPRVPPPPPRAPATAVLRPEIVDPDSPMPLTDDGVDPLDD